MIFKLPPQLGQCSTFMSKTRLSSRAQLIRAGAPCACAPSLKVSVAGSGGAGMILLRNLAFGASTPWKRPALSRSKGIRCDRARGRINAGELCGNVDS